MTNDEIRREVGRMLRLQGEEEQHRNASTKARHEAQDIKKRLWQEVQPDGRAFCVVLGEAAHVFRTQGDPYSDDSSKQEVLRAIV